MKKVKKLIYTLSIVLALSFIITPIQTNATDWTTYTVHITRTGSKYHRGGCTYLRKSDYTINILDAIKQFLSLYDYYIALLNSMSTVFDADYYYLYNTDISSMIGYDKIALLNHFLTQGMAEGRQGNVTFNVQYYMNNNPDLIPLYGNDLLQYYMHYINYGQYEEKKSSKPSKTN